MKVTNLVFLLAAATALPHYEQANKSVGNRNNGSNDPQSFNPEDSDNMPQGRSNNMGPSTSGRRKKPCNGPNGHSQGPRPDMNPDNSGNPSEGEPENPSGENPSTPDPTPAPTNGEFSPDKLLQLHNSIRAKYNAPPLTNDAALAKVAQAHSDDQARTGNMSHSGSDGSSPGQRVSRAGIKSSGSAENVAWNQPNEQAVVKAWENSSGHLDNIKNSRYTKLGCGMKNKYWTCNFI